jgi:hypothetical protein
VKFIFIGCLLLNSVFAVAKTIQFQKSWKLPADYKLGPHKVGGLSGCVKKENKIYFISDDRGGEGGARIISFDWDSEKNEIQFKSGQSLSLQKANSKKILDLEGIAINSKNEFLLSNEGDQNKKPRQSPEIFWTDFSGQRLRSVTLPNEFLPNASGQQTKGVQNNLAFEGLSSDLTLQKWGAFLEGPVIDSVGTLANHLSYIESDIDSLKVQQTYSYPMPQFENSAMTMIMGVTDFLFLSADQLLVLERGVELSMQGLVFNTQLCFAEKDKTYLKRKCSYIFNSDAVLIKSIQKTANFEGLCWLNEKKTQFMVVSDNNFSKNENTVFLFYNLN